MRVELADVEPLVWRQIEIASDLTLDKVHRVLQTVLGWTDSHLHEFSRGSEPHERSAERYLMAFSVEDGAVGIDERRVRLDEVLVEPGDRLWYQYDFGDDWTHALDLEAVLPHDPSAPPARCLSGERACPPEDCGGIGGYEDLRRVLAGPPGPERDEMRLWTGPDFDPARFDADAVDAALAATVGLRAPEIDPDSPLGDLLAHIGIPPLIAATLDALADPAPTITAADRADAVRHYSRLLDRVADDGIALTQAGYLPPAHVAELSVELGLDHTWIGKNNREVNTYPVLDFRESAQGLGLLRKLRNRLLLTKAGKRAQRDPEYLWQHIADALPLSLAARGPEAEAGQQAGTLLLLAVAAGLSKSKRDEIVATGLSAHGWQDGDGNPISASHANHLASRTSAVLGFARAMPSPHVWPEPSDQSIPAAGVALSRTALGL